MQTSRTGEDRMDHERAVRTSLELLKRNRSAGAAQRLDEGLRRLRSCLGAGTG